MYLAVDTVYIFGNVVIYLSLLLIIVVCNAFVSTGTYCRENWGQIRLEDHKLKFPHFQM